MFFFRNISQGTSIITKSQFWSEDTQKYYWLDETGCQIFMKEYEELKGIPCYVGSEKQLLQSFKSRNGDLIFSGNISVFDKEPEVRNFLEIEKCENGFIPSEKGAFIQNGNRMIEDEFYSKKFHLRLPNKVVNSLIV